MTETSTALERLDLSGNLEDVLARLMGARAGDLVPTTVALPAPKATLSEAVVAALARMPDLYGAVAPDTRRRLDSHEASTLIDEREVLGILKKACEERIAQIKTIAFNHLDVELEEAEAVEGKTKDKVGHYNARGEIRAEGKAKRITRETSEATPQVSEVLLRRLAEDPEVPEFTHQDYLNWTRAERVVDKPAIMADLQRNPAKAQLLAKAATIEPRSPSAYLR